MTALKEGSFRLTKWTSKDTQVIPLSGTLPLSEKSAASINVDLDDTSIESALGIQSNPKTDTLQIKVSDRDTAMTKRSILSYTSSMFDILGILAPLILEQKLTIQSLWKVKADWGDKEIPYSLKNHFERWKTVASAYGTVAYVRSKCQSKFKCSFINSKARLVLMNEKQLSMPRLELQPAVLVCRMRSVIVEETKCELKEVHLWTDSKIVINYIKNEITNFGVFIAHHINEIRNNSTVNKQHYVSTKDNFADDLTRYKGFDSLQNASRWCNGLDVLHNNLENQEIVNVNTISTKDKNRTLRRT